MKTGVQIVINIIIICMNHTETFVYEGFSNLLKN